MPKLIAVTGATGQQGSSVVDFLLKEPAGHFTIRAITRNPSSPASKALAAKGIEVVQADLSSLEQTTKAFEGAWGVFGVTQFYEHGYDAEQLHGKNIVEATKKAGVKHLVWSTVEGREGECQAISWKSKALIEDRVLESGVPYTFVYIPMYYENFWTSFFAPSYNEEKGFHWSVAFLPDVPIFAFSVADLGGLVVAAFREPEKYSGVKIKTVVEYLSLRDLATQFAEVTGEKASLALELTPEQFEATRFVDHPAAELMYLSWEYVKRAGPESGVRDKKQTLTIYPQAKSYREWVKDSPLVRDLVQKLKAESKQSKA
ncbi:NmrA family protein [Stereum hirsutum FP-91666 SS1]|uniref:NmrA family protein n=1 Tax=Stereum hirsutum (strain FP-91666) TaxID=721885 RepID=UPI000444A5D1|nr:NmrA family protein [Stereum hirsutum FP-91666 SS1]EIM83982.1 NmrA family protein [Stereum hirsutum FP-91666 SS1]